MEAAPQLQFPKEALAPILEILRGPRRTTVLSGAVGSGKLTALQQVARALELRVAVLFLEGVVDVGNLEPRLLHALRPNLEGATVVAVRGAELIRPGALERLVALELHVHCVLLTNEKLRGVPRERIVYHPRPTNEFCLELAWSAKPRGAI
jgi:hypothetical protein